MVKRLAVSVVLLLFASTAYADKYGDYDTQRLFTVVDTPSGKKTGLDVGYLDRMLNDLFHHAKDYPPRFDSPKDKERAVRDVKAASKLLDSVTGDPKADPEVLWRAALLNHFGYSLDVPGSAAKAVGIFQKILAANPSDPRGNYMFGDFLSSAGKPKEALPYLQKAISLGVPDAAYTLGMTYVLLGDKENALKNLEEYRRRHPNSGIDKVIDGVRSGKVHSQTLNIPR